MTKGKLSSHRSMVIGTGIPARRAERRESRAGMRGKNPWNSQDCLRDEFLSFFLSFFLGGGRTHGKCKFPDWGRIGAAATILHHSHSNMGSNCICSLHHSSWQCRILNPLKEARDGIHILMDTSWVSYHWAMMGTPDKSVSIQQFPHTQSFPSKLSVFWSQKDTKLNPSHNPAYSLHSINH